MASFPSSAEIQEELPTLPSLNEKISYYRQTLREIFQGKDSRLILIVGPCSIHHLPSAYEYAEKLLELQKKVEDRFFILMRTYFEKPRTSISWKGFLYDPLLDDSGEMEMGVRLARSFLLDLAKKGLPAAAELLDPFFLPYFSDLLTWGCIGARTCLSQPHRQLAASLPFPIGFKNTPDGNVLNAIHGVCVAKAAHHFLHLSPEGRLEKGYAAGNPDCHIVLRGSEQDFNYDAASLAEAWEKCQEFHLNYPLLIDCAHGNCQKDPQKQILAFQNVMEQISQNQAPIAGLMLESHLFEGNQPLRPSLRYGVSITDPCLSWDQTASLIETAYSQLEGSSSLAASH